MNPKLEHTGKYAILLATFVLAIAGRLFTVPVGFKFDGASIPRLVWAVMGHPFSSVVLGPAIVHDWLCALRVFESAYVHWLFGQALLDRWRRDFRVAPRLRRQSFRILRRSVRTRMWWEWRRAWRFAHARLCYVAVRLFGPRFQARQ